MAKKLQFKRLLALTLLMAAAFAGLSYRLVDLQVVRHVALAKEARSNTQYTWHLEPRRGDILDIKGNLLATSVFVKTVCADPTLIGDRAPEVAKVLAPFLMMPAAELEKRLAPRFQKNKLGENVPVAYVTLKRKVSTDTWDKIQQAMASYPFGGVEKDREKHLPKKLQTFYRYLREKAIFADPVDDQLRTYPNNELAAHVLGFVGLADETNSDGTRMQVTVGEDGIEKRFDAKLKGVRGWRVSERDRQQREMVSLREQDVSAHDGLSVVLTIDSEIQHIVETELAEGMRKHSPVSISGMVIRPRTGEILAMCTLPNFDPNNPGAALPEWRRNRIVTDASEPGSTFKIVVVSGALNDHVVRLTDQFDCEHGHFFYGGRTLHDHEPYGILSVENIITKSSNIGAAKIGILLTAPRLYDYVRAYGFGTPTGIPLPYESRGIVHPLTNWTKVSITHVPMGHEVQVTPLQMAMAMCAIANHGVLMQPMLVDHLVDTDGSIAVQYYPQEVRRVVSEDADHEMIEALKTVVLSDGTAAGAALTNYTIAGKTGTAQEAEHGGYEGGKYFSSFIGFFPADNPEICIYVAMDAPKDGHYGGKTAAPIFHEIAERAANYLNITPDRGNPVGMPEMQIPGSDQPLKTASTQ
jgi:cell division protein FtsI/penicillin-binding protein 2